MQEPTREQFDVMAQGYVTVARLWLEAIDKLANRYGDQASIDLQQSEMYQNTRKFVSDFEEMFRRRKECC